MKYKNFIWDFDGTLFDSYPAMIESFMLALKEENIEENPQTIERLMKVSVSTVIEYIHKKYECSTEFVNRFNEIRKQIEIKTCIPYVDTLETCQRIVDEGGRNFIFTHRGNSTIELLEKHNMGCLFTECITKENGFERKPNPEGITYLVSKYNLDKEDTILIGDRELDIQAGVQANIKTCYFNNENKPAIDYATLTISTLNDLLTSELIKQ